MEGQVVVALIIAILLSESWGLDDAYLGCFYDVYHAPIGPPDPLFCVLPLGKLRSTDMTIGRCITHCVELQDDITYAGLEAGDECYCGTADADYEQGGRGRRSDRDCLGRPCAGNVKQACGDGFSIAVYNVQQIHCEVPKTNNFLNPPGFVPVQMFETFACRPGYTLMGTTTVQCIFDDSIGDTRWVPDLPMCLFTGIGSTVSKHDVTGSTSSTRADRTGAIAGAVFVLLLAVFLVIVICVWKRHATSHKQTHRTTSTTGEGTILVEPVNSDTYLDLDPTSRNTDTEYQGLYTNPDADIAVVHPDANANENLDLASHNEDAEYRGIYTNPDDNASHRNAGTRQESPADINSSRRVPIPPAVVKQPEDAGSYYVNVKDKSTK